MSCTKTTQHTNLLNADQVKPKCLTIGRTVLCLRKIEISNTVDNCKPISCIPHTGKLSSGIVTESVYKYLRNKNGIMSHGQKGRKPNCKDTNNYLLIDKTVHKECHWRKVNLVISWMDYRKA